MGDCETNVLTDTLWFNFIHASTLYVKNIRQNAQISLKLPSAEYKVS